MELSVSVVGAGDRGTTHARIWKSIAGARVVAVCDIDRERACRLAEETGASPYEDFRRAIDHDAVNVVSVCLPTFLHRDAAVHAARRGAHIFCEKPLALTVPEGNEILRAVEESGVAFSLCFQNRDNGAFAHVRSLFRAGEFGGPVHFSFVDVREVRPKPAMHRRSMNGGPVIDMACHVFDLARYVTGCEILSVYADGHVFGKGKARLRDVEDFAIDEASISARLSGGHHLHTYINWGMPEGHASPGNTWCFIGPALSVHPEGSSVVERRGGESRSVPFTDPGTHARIAAFAEAARAGRAPDVAGADGLAALKASHAALESIATGRAIDIP